MAASILYKQMLTSEQYKKIMSKRTKHVDSRARVIEMHETKSMRMK